MRSKLLFVVAALAAGCATAPSGPPIPAIPLVRLTNAGPVDLENIEVTFDRVPVRYGSLRPGQSSAYRMAQGAYRYAAIRATVAGRPIVVQPIDFVGETPLAPGFYSYRLAPEPNAGLTITLVSDPPPR